MKKKLISVLLTLLLAVQAPLAFASSFELLPFGDGSFEFTGTRDSETDTTLVIWSESSGALMAISQISAGSDSFSQIIDLGFADDANYAMRVNGIDAPNFKNISSHTAVTQLSDAPSGNMVHLLKAYRNILGIDTSGLDIASLADIIAEAMAAETFSSASDAAAKYELISGSAAELGKAAALSLIASGKAAEALTKYILLFDVDASAFASLADKSIVYNTLNGNTYTEEQFKSAFGDALILSQINEASGASFKTLVTLHEGKIGIDASAIADAVYAKVDSSVFTDFISLKTAFINESSLHRLNQATRETIQSVLVAENAILGILDTAGYSSLTDSQKSAACMALAGGNYATIEAAKAEFAKIIPAVQSGSTYTPPSSSDNSGSGNSFGFSGGGTATVLPDIPVSALPFKDITKAHWGYTSVASLYEKGIISGTSATTFEPDREVTREEFVKMLVGTFGLYNPDAKNVFTDVPAGDWCEKYVASAYECGLTEGRGDGSFGKGDILTRQDMAVLAARCASIARLSLSGNNTLLFADEADFAPYAADSIYALSGAGIINGVGDGLYSPHSSCTRVMAAKVCHALLNLYTGGGAN